jgi:hypothetical protein
MSPKQYLALAASLAAALPAAALAQQADTPQPKTCLPQGGFNPVATY